MVCTAKIICFIKKLLRRSRPRVSSFKFHLQHAEYMLEKLKVPAEGLEARGRLMYSDFGKFLHIRIPFWNFVLLS